jgi:hypothetical protein
MPAPVAMSLAALSCSSTLLQVQYIIHHTPHTTLIVLFNTAAAHGDGVMLSTFDEHFTSQVSLSSNGFGGGVSSNVPTITKGYTSSFLFCPGTGGANSIVMSWGGNHTITLRSETPYMIHSIHYSSHAIHYSSHAIHYSSHTIHYSSHAIHSHASACFQRYEQPG